MLGYFVIYIFKHTDQFTIMSKHFKIHWAVYNQTEHCKKFVQKVILIKYIIMIKDRNQDEQNPYSKKDWILIIFKRKGKQKLQFSVCFSMFGIGYFWISKVKLGRVRLSKSTFKSILDQLTIMFKI